MGVPSAKSKGSAKGQYLALSNLYHTLPFLLTEDMACLFAAFLAHQSLKPQSISVYLAAIQHLQVSAGLDLTPHDLWPRLQYVLKGIKQFQVSLTPAGSSTSYRRHLALHAGGLGSHTCQPTVSGLPTLGCLLPRLLWFYEGRGVHHCRP